MPATPVYDAVMIAWAAIFAAIDPLTASPIYWAQAEEGVEPPWIRGQSQDNGGRAEKRLDKIGWSGLIALIGVASNPTAAAALVNAVAPGMVSLTSVGYNVSADYMQPINLPPDVDGRWQAGHIWRVYLETV